MQWLVSHDFDEAHASRHPPIVDGLTPDKENPSLQVDLDMTKWFSNSYVIWLIQYKYVVLRTKSKGSWWPIG